MTMEQIFVEGVGSLLHRSLFLVSVLAIVLQLIPNRHGSCHEQLHASIDSGVPSCQKKNMLFDQRILATIQPVA